MIDRMTVVSRNCPEIKEIDYYAPLSVGNGHFAYTADFTGLQTFTKHYTETMPLCTMSDWGWHSHPLPAGMDKSSIKPHYYDTFGRQVGYYSDGTGQEDIFNYLRQNPHRFHLGNIGFDIEKSNGEKIVPDDVKNISQRLDLYNGIIYSEFEIEGVKVYCKTCCHGNEDIIGVSVESPLIKTGRLKIKLSFPYGSQSMCGADFEAKDKHTSTMVYNENNAYVINHTLDEMRYFVTMDFDEQTECINSDTHEFVFSSKDDKIDFSAQFRAEMHKSAYSDNKNTFLSSINKWNNYWKKGGIIDFSGSTDERAAELEKRVIQSMYLTAIQSAGNIPPQETGLTCNSWFGKAHLEMHWWHAAHFPLWERGEYLENSMWWYKSVMPIAEANAKRQGYKGARWQKMVDHLGVDSPSAVATLLVWQQPHPIYYAELLYRENPSDEILKRYKDIVFKTAEFMADFVHYDKENDRYVLGAPLIPAQENHACMDTLNPTYEVEYFYEMFRIANEWKRRLGEEENSLWSEITEKISNLPVLDGVYLAHEKCPDTFAKFNIDHPSMLNALGVLKGCLVDRDVMKKTLETVLDSWTMERTWGWDYPVMAMCATRLSMPETAIDCLFLDTPKNGYLKNGHNYQRPSLPLYLPGNGGLLAAVAVMVAGYDGCEEDMPGIPKNGKWNVKYENIMKLI